MVVWYFVLLVDTFKCSLQKGCVVVWLVWHKNTLFIFVYIHSLLSIKIIYSHNYIKKCANTHTTTHDTANAVYKRVYKCGTMPHGIPTYLKNPHKEVKK